MINEFTIGTAGTLLLVGLLSVIAGVAVVFTAPGALDITGTQSDIDIDCDWQVVEGQNGETFETKDELYTYLDNNNIEFDEDVFEFRNDETGNNLEYRLFGC